MGSGEPAEQLSWRKIPDGRAPESEPAARPRHCKRRSGCRSVPCAERSLEHANAARHTRENVNPSGLPETGRGIGERSLHSARSRPFFSDPPPPRRLPRPGTSREGPRGQGRRPASGAGGASLAVCVWLTDAPSACRSHPTPAARWPSPRSPCPRACVFHLLVYLYFCPIPRASEIMQYLPLSFWLLPPGTMPSRPIRTVAEGKVPFLFTAA